MNPRKRTYLSDSETNLNERRYLEWKQMICDVFIKAVIEHDRKTILELADAAAFFEDKLGDDFTPADPVRFKLLKIKNQPRLYQKKFTMRQIAEQVYDKKCLVAAAADGFSRLRQTCKQLGIQIIPSRHTSKK
jgi:hypothetical protein